MSVSEKRTRNQRLTEHPNEKRRLDREPSSFAGSRVPMRPTTLAEQIQMVTTRLAASVSQLRQNTPVDALRQDLLGQLVRHRRQLVVVVDTPVVSVQGNTFGGRLRVSARLERVVRVKFPAQLGATAARGEESSVAVLRQGPQPETTRASPKRRLRPLVVVRVKTGKLLEAGPDLIIEAGDGSRVEARRDSPDGENHFAESRAAAQQVESDLRVGQLAESFQELAGLADPILGMRVAELR